MTNVLQKQSDSSSTSQKVQLQREYVFKCGSKEERILGVSIIDESGKGKLAGTVRIYIFTSECRLHCLEVSKRVV
jgi:hypothetical protein